MTDFSIILATMGDNKEDLKRFIKSLESQSTRNFELIFIIDCSSEIQVDELVEPYEIPQIKTLTSDKGLSGARNQGIDRAEGELLAFPDDDCYYQRDILETAKSLLTKKGLGFVTGRSVNSEGQDTNARWDSKSGVINRYNVWTRAISYTIFIKKSVVTNISGFDEEIGKGSNTGWGAGEETDLCIRAMQESNDGYYSPDLKVYHPSPIAQDIRSEARSYGRGMGAVLKKNQYSRLFLLYWLVRSFLGFILNLLKLDTDLARYHLSSMIGRLEGWLQYSQN